MITGQRHIAGEDVAFSQGDETVVRLCIVMADELVGLKPSTDGEVLHPV